ncbi:CLUMA_CG019360, isoform A [Clunio marinus]|uniref:CLUMA_CG019360, isoform A n=1 Tax=Clunio marinus TaxID=568069 RepID=A0A1J1J0C1_9DIPT|nr:CLUMA_CG019360, isoform A [Clunio marinus]
MSTQTDELHKKNKINSIVKSLPSNHAVTITRSIRLLAFLCQLFFLVYEFTIPFTIRETHKHQQLKAKRKATAEIIGDH